MESRETAFPETGRYRCIRSQGEPVVYAALTQFPFQAQSISSGAACRLFTLLVLSPGVS